ncbi:hypothetical protein ABK040_009368 [Willaertia magna]
MNSKIIISLFLLLSCIVLSAISQKVITPEDYKTNAIDLDIIQEINENASSSFKAGISKKFIGKSIADVKKLLGVNKRVQERPYNEEELNIMYRYKRAKESIIEKYGLEFAKEKFPQIFSIPSSFDSRIQWPGCIHPISNQEQCGSCWAFSATEVLSDRFCIATQGKINVTLSPQNLVSCDYNDQGCNGGLLQNAWWWLNNEGVVPDWCMPYTSGNNGKDGECTDTCTSNQSINRKSQSYYAKTYGSVINVLLWWKRIEDMQNELIKNGPIQAAFDVYQDFISYKSGVYKHRTGSYLGGHAVKIIGWGSENNQDYWLVANSWGTSWGENGFFKIARGNNECGIEDYVYAGIPDTSRVPSTN